MNIIIGGRDYYNDGLLNILIEWIGDIMSKYLTKEAILEAQDLKTKEVEVLEWGGVVLLKAMSGKERDAFEASLQGKEAGTINLDNVRAKLASKCIVDEEGKRLFSDSEIETLGMKSAAALDRIFEEAKVLSGIGDEDIKEMVKNSETVPSEDSISA